MKDTYLINALNQKGYYQINQIEWENEYSYFSQLVKQDRLGFLDLPYKNRHRRYIYKVNHKNTYLISIAFRIPKDFIPVDELFSKLGKKKKEDLAEFLQVWALQKRVGSLRIRDYHSLYTFRAGTVTVPKFLQSQLYAYLNSFKFVFKELSPEYAFIKCPDCEIEYKMIEDSLDKRCPHCGSISCLG